jgi:hypothetical protein
VDTGHELLVGAAVLFAFTLAGGLLERVLWHPSPLYGKAARNRH